MDYITYLVETNKHKNVEELAKLYEYSAKLKYHSTGDIMISEQIETAILWILKFKDKIFNKKFNAYKRRIDNE